MGTFNSSRFYSAPISIAGQVVNEVTEQLRDEGYEVTSTTLLSGGADISVTKGGYFKSVVGMKSALKVVIRPENNGFSADARVGIFGQQVVPTLVSTLILWPVLFTQIWGLVRQSKLDDHVLDLIEESVKRQQYSKPQKQNGEAGFIFCTHCGNKVPEGSTFCNGCGKRL